jgi:hypothetical protein
MPTLFRFLVFCGVVAGIALGGLYALGEFYPPEPKEISHPLRNFKVRDQ